MFSNYVALTLDALTHHAAARIIINRASQAVADQVLFYCAE